MTHKLTNLPLLLFPSQDLLFSSLAKTVTGLDARQAEMAGKTEKQARQAGYSAEEICQVGINKTPFLPAPKPANPVQSPAPAKGADLKSTKVATKVVKANKSTESSKKKAEKVVTKTSMADVVLAAKAAADAKKAAEASTPSPNPAATSKTTTAK